MRFFVLYFFVFLLFLARTAAKPASSKGGQGSYLQKAVRRPVPTVDSNDDEELRQSNKRSNDNADYNDETLSYRNAVPKASDSRGRFFMRRFMGLKNLFGRNNQPIIIRVILNGTNTVPNIPTTPATPTAPTAPVTSPITPTVPTSPTVTTTNPTGPSGTNTNPTGPAGTNTNPTGPTVIQPPITQPTGPIPRMEGSFKNDYSEDYKKTLSELPARSHKVMKTPKEIIVRIPAKYRHLFDNGQQVKLGMKKVSKRRNVDVKRDNSNRKQLHSNRSFKNQNKLVQFFEV